MSKSKKSKNEAVDQENMATPEEDVAVVTGEAVEEETTGGETSEEAKGETKSETEGDNTGESAKKDWKHKTVFEELGDHMGKLANKTVESIKQTLDQGLISRNTVLTIRVTDEANKKLSMLVNAGIFKSRSESAAYLIEEGIKHQDRLFQKITDKLDTIEKLKEELKDIVSGEMDDQ